MEDAAHRRAPARQGDIWYPAPDLDRGGNGPVKRETNSDRPVHRRRASIHHTGRIAMRGVDMPRERRPEPDEDLDALDRNLALELVRVTEGAAMAASRWVGRGDKNAADAAA